MRAAIPMALCCAVLAACEAPPAAVQPPPPSDACGASGLQGLVGQHRRVLERMSLPQPLRVIGPEMAVTADYRPDRLNIEYDRRGTIAKISCY